MCKFNSTTRLILVSFFFLAAHFVFSDGLGFTTDNLPASGSIKKAFIEKSPIIDEVEVLLGDPFVEVYIKGRAEMECYPEREYHVEKRDGETRIIPRFRTSDINKKCESKLVEFREKAADLDAQSSSSAKIKVLGYMGWIEKIFNKDIQPVQK